MPVIGYDRPVKDLIDQLSATGHVTHSVFRKTMVTVHHNAGVLTHEDVLNAWRTREASAHFDVDARGAVAQYVNVNEYAWACGNTQGNQSSISIEQSNIGGGPDWPVSETTWRETARLAGWLFAHVIGTRPNSNNLVPHHYWYSTSCPGPYMDRVFGQLISLAQQAYDSFVSGAVGGSMDEQTILKAFLNYQFARQGMNEDNKPQQGTANIDAIFKNMDSGWSLPVRALKPLIEAQGAQINALSAKFDELVTLLKNQPQQGGGLAHVKIEGDFPFTPSS